MADILPENTREFGFCNFFGRYFALCKLSAFSWQSYGTYFERKKELADFWNLVIVFLLNFETNFGGKRAETSRNQNLDLRVANAMRIGDERFYIIAWANICLAELLRRYLVAAGFCILECQTHLVL